MSLDLDQDARPLTSVDDLVEWFRSAERPVAEHRIGLEHEKLIFPKGGIHAPPYEGPAGIGALLEGLAQRGYGEYRESPSSPVIALMKGQLTVSLEPGGQFELSGSPFATAREAHAENLAHLSDVIAVGEALGVYPVALGYRPFDQIESMPWMPKTRYRAMREVLPRRGGHALDMMLMTATGQVSLDWASEEDCVSKVVLAARLAPVLVALYANSPLVRGAPSGFASFRSHVWTDVDPSRCGFLPSMFDGSFSYRAYVDWALDAPLLFLRRGGQYLNPNLTFGQLLEQGYDGKPATFGDWADHVSTLFPEVRIKKVIELRSADSVPPELTGALAALWRGVLYDATARADAARILPPLSFTQHLELMAVARRSGLRGVYGEVRLADAARELVAIGRAGLQRLDPDDAPLLDPLEALAKEGRSLSDRVLEMFDRKRDPAKLLEALALRG
ncbi:MAG: glutamate--cysteine ligase [Myxococcaceae bacterium]|nr:glutamate--cysteine ligase [Myxococcaceae bacterium]